MGDNASLEVTEEPPFVVDLDGTLLRSDLLLETGLAFVREQPHQLLAPLWWLVKGKATLKHELAHATEVDVSLLPYNRSVVELVESERARGRRVVLATASHGRLADRVAAHLQLFDQVIATDSERNLSADAKRDALVGAFGERGFDYVGDSRDDLPVWRAARRAYLVDPTPSVERRARAFDNVSAVIRSDGIRISDWGRALRLHQWVKNLLIFVPLIAAHRYGELALVGDALMAFLSFGLCASSVYILNDLVDIADDRNHSRKRFRPFAAGRLPILWGLFAFPVTLALAFAISASTLPFAFTSGLGIYYVLTLAYSFFLKRRTIVDVITLAALYTLRIVLGAMAVGVALSFWLLAFSMFIFLSLALVKRFAELFQVRAKGQLDRALGRGYLADDLPIIAALGAAAGYMAVLVLALYINDARTADLYSHPEFIWLACPLLLTWISRIWLLTHRGRMHEDPVTFAVTDRVSLVIGAVLLAVFWAAT